MSDGINAATCRCEECLETKRSLNEGNARRSAQMTRAYSYPLFTMAEIRERELLIEKRTGLHGINPVWLRLEAVRELRLGIPADDNIKQPRNSKVTQKSTKKDRPVIVTTKHRGVFFGYADDTDGDPIWLRRARLCVYWSADCKGFMGLAANGPTAGCRIGPAVDIELREITAVLEVTPEAVKRWEQAPWG